MMKISNTPSAVQKAALAMADSYKDCFCWYSEELYVRGFAQRHMETLFAINESEYGVKISKKNQKLFIDTFTETMLNTIYCMKKEHNKKEKAEIKKKGVRRKKGD